MFIMVQLYSMVIEHPAPVNLFVTVRDNLATYLPNLDTICTQIMGTSHKSP